MAVRLLLTAGAEEQWRDVAEPWLRNQEAWRDPRPAVVLTASRAHGFYLRGRLVEKGIPALGLRFWTPSDARKFLLGEMNGNLRAITQTDLRLLTRLAAERLLRDQKTVERASLASVVQDPGAFLRAYDLVLGAGWDPARDGAEYGRMLAAELGRDLARLNVATQAGIHRHLREASPAGKPPLARVLILGFNAVHWPLWDLVQAVCHAADEAWVALDSPGVFARAADELWIGSWESFAGASYEIPEGTAAEEEESSLAILATSYEAGTQVDAREANIHFIATAELATQVRSVVLQALEYLKQPACTRLGIVFPEANALALGVAEQLRAIELPLDDGSGAIQTGLFEARPWQTWMELQEEPTVRSLVHWLRACEAEELPCGLSTVPAGRAAELLDWALGQTLIDDLDFLALQMEKESSDNKHVADFLRKRVALPAESTLAGYLTSTREALRRLGWKDHLELLPEEVPPWLAASGPMARTTYLAWLRETADSRERVRHAGNHFYGRIHLLLYGQMAGQTWSHLILTGMNEGVWPRLFESGAFGSRYEQAELNQKARTLNREGTSQGAQGEGHETVAPDHAHWLLPMERYELSLRDLCSALQATSHSVCLTAMTLGGGRNLLPSDFFNHAWCVKTGQALEDGVFRNLAKITAERCRQHDVLFPVPAAEAQDVSSVRKAYDARRDYLKPFGPYEFAYATPPAAPIQLPCKKWETALGHPAIVWLSEIVGVGPWPEGDLKWPLAIGTWVHRWLMLALRDGAPADLTQSLREASEQDFARMEKRAHTAGIELYPWWKHVWGQARSITLALGGSLAPELVNKKILSEVSLPPDLLVALPGCTSADFALQGKIDLLLIEPSSAIVDPKKLNLADCSCWIVDFKTGSAKKMNAKLIGDGNAVQIVLYGLAVRALGAESTAMSLHTFDAPLARQVTVDDLVAITGVFRSLDIIHRLGVFGQSPAGDNEYTFQPDYPITTRSIPAQVLAAKWALVHDVPAGDVEVTA